MGAQNIHATKPTTQNAKVRFLSIRIHLKDNGNSNSAVAEKIKEGNSVRGDEKWGRKSHVLEAARVIGFPVSLQIKEGNFMFFLLPEYLAFLYNTKLVYRSCNSFGAPNIYST